MRHLRRFLTLLLALVVPFATGSPAEARVRCDDWADCGLRDDGYDRDYRDYYDDLPERLPVVTVTRATVDAVLSSAGLEACLEPLAGRHRATVRVYVSTDGSTHVRARVAPHDEGAETCLRRTAQAVLEWGAGSVRVRRAFSTRIALATARSVPDAAVEAEAPTLRTEAVRAVVTSAHATLAACLDATGDGSVGTLALTVRVARSGRLTLRGARVGRLIPDDEALTCLQDTLRALAVEPGGERLETTVELAL